MTAFLISALQSAPLPRSSPWDACRFALARAEQVAVAPFAHPRALAARLQVDDVESAERYALARTLVALYQGEPCPLWAELLLRSYVQMIAGVRAQVHLGRLNHGDVDQLVMLKFLELARRIDLRVTGEYVTHALARDLRRDVFRALDRERRELGWLKDQRSITVAEPAQFVDTAHIEACAVWSSITRGRDAKALAEHLVLARDGSLRAHIYETAPGSPTERRRAYQRAKDSLARFVKEAKDSLARDDSAVCE